MNRDNSQTGGHQRISRFLSLVLRHQPQKIGISLDKAGWTDVDALLTAMQKSGFPISHTVLADVVATNDKQRFQFNTDRTRIRATQGHSVTVDHGYEPAEPPTILFHGTPDTVLAAIRSEGLRKMQRHHVHLHADRSLAESVGARRGRPVVLKIRALDMWQAGFLFYRSDNAVWLTDHVPPEFIND
ncbi:MAG: RNA 2'-phosphotransferase [Planctomycetaceae bacterium]|nr:RNA 2'-phosphotransferase [Planctomycetaceae bacterium]